MLNSSVGAAGEWLSAGEKMASRKSCADCFWGSFCRETVHISSPPICWLPQRSSETLLFVFDRSD